jgi:carbon-monoxide dehydrogenase medium subunit
VPASALFRGLFATALAADEILTEVRVPPQPQGWGLAELSRRAGDFALAGVAVAIDTAPGDRRRCARARVVAFGAGDRPMRLRASEAVLAGAWLDADTAVRAAQAASPEIDPPDDVHATAEYRRHLVAVLAERALLDAFAQVARVSR